ncbi:MAG: hypothetical protein JXA73_02995 [Acidobacteria bacterium]|nr:hypothetical protein [Acidobacteriota bacterium]
MEGETLSDLSKHSPIVGQESLKLTLQMAEALEDRPFNIVLIAKSRCRRGGGLVIRIRLGNPSTVEAGPRKIFGNAVPDREYAT